MDDFWSKLRFGVRKQKGLILGFGAAGLATILALQFWGVDWWGAVEAIIGIATLAVAFLVWIGEFSENWEESLPKRLKVFYLYEGKPAMVCEDSVLLAEGDIRAWGLQVGAQIAGEQQLKLSPIFESLPPRIERLPDVGPVRRYQIRMNLDSLPKRVKDRREEAGKSGDVIVRRIVGGNVDERWVSSYPL